MTDKKIIALAEKTDDGRHVSPEQLLEGCLKELEPGGELHGFKKLIVIGLDDSTSPDKTSKYNWSYTQAGMHFTEIITLLNAIIKRLLDDMT